MQPEEMTDKDLAAAWRRAVDENKKFGDELIKRGYKFTSKKTGQQLLLISSDIVRITMMPREIEL